MGGCKMKRLVFRVVAIMCIAAISAAMLSGCGYPGYRGENADAYTLICNQVPDILGARRALVTLQDPQIIAVERDGEGRLLFLYLEDTDEMLSCGIVQKSDGERVYFYPERSTLSFVMPDEFFDLDNKKIPEEDLKQLFRELCPEDLLDSFKNDNDWNLPIDEEKLDSAEIKPQMIAVPWGDRIDTVNLSDREWKTQIFAYAQENGYDFSEIDEDDMYFSHSSPMAVDDYGRRLYYVEADYYYHPNDDSHISYVRHFLEMIAIINPDGSFNSEVFMSELKVKSDYQAAIAELKELNAWDRPLGE